MTLSAQARRFLWLFPAWCRADRGEEAVGLVLDLVPVGRTRLPLQSRLDLIRAGLHARRVYTPPVWVWWEVLTSNRRNGGGRIPAEWHAWLIERVSSPHRKRQHRLDVAVCTLPVAFLPGLIASPGNGLALWFVTWMLTANTDEWRRTVLVRNGYDEACQPLDPSLLATSWSMPALPNLDLGRLMRWAAMGLGTSLILGAVNLRTRVVGSPLGWSWPAALLTIAFAGVAFVRVLPFFYDQITVAQPSPNVEKVRADVVPWKKNLQRRNRRGLVVMAAFVLAVVAFAGWPSLVVGAVALVLVLLTARSVRRREAVLGHNLRVWDVVPTLGPRWVVERPPPTWQRPGPPSPAA